MVGSGGEEVGLIVRVQAKGQSGAMDKLKKDVSGSVEQGAKQGSMKLPGIIGDVVNSAQRTMSSAGRSYGGMGGGGLGGGMLGSMASGVIVLAGMLSILKSILNRMIQASPMLASIVDQLNQGFNLMLRPMADSIGRFLRPMAEAIIEQGILNIEAMDQAQSDLENMGITGTAQDLAMMVISWYQLLQTPTKMFAEMLVGLGTWVSDATAGFREWFSGGLNTVISSLSGGIDQIGNMLGGLGSWIWTNVTTGLGSIGSWIYTSITGAMSNIGSSVSGLGSWLWTSITGAVGSLGSVLGGFGNWLWTSIVNSIGSIGSSLGGIGNEVYKAVHNALAGAFNSIHNFTFSVLGQNIMPFTAIPTIAYLAEGGITNGATLAMIGEGRGGMEREVVSPLSDLKELLGSTGTTTIEWHQHAPIYGVNDLERTVDGIVERSNRRNRGSTIA